MFLEQTRGRSRGTRKGGPSGLLCDRPLAERATLVRGSSRRITTMPAGFNARSANIRVINRRRSRFDRRLVCSRNRDAPTQSDVGSFAAAFIPIGLYLVHLAVRRIKTVGTVTHY